MDDTICRKCGKKFSKMGNLRAHVKTQHPDNVNTLAPKVKRLNATYKCNKCDATFVHVCNLRVHIRKKHPGELEPVKSKIYKCKLCSAEFKMFKHLSSHKKNHLVKKHCPLCHFADSSTKNLITHYKSEHSVAIHIESLAFESFEAFEAWKLNVEKDTFASFVNMHGSRQNLNLKKIKYTCHRSGSIRIRGKNERKMKAQGSNKLNAYCPAEMDVIVEETKCIVKFCKTHIGHKQEQDMGHLFLSLSERQSIAAKIAAKVPIQNILDEIRDSVSNCHLERLHLLTKKDLYNIGKAFHLNASSMRHSNDATSVDAWVNELKASGIILFYKPQETVCNECSDLRYEDFLLIIMTEGQKEFLLRFGNDCICVDGTHRLNGYGFELHTILILDDLREGYPSAFCISNRNDAKVMQIFFSCVKERIERVIKPRVFMSDMADSYYNAWLEVMHPAQFRLYSTWHVNKSWKKNLAKISNDEKKVLVYHMLRMLLQERDLGTFKILLQKFLNYCRESPETLEFANYFHDHYFNKAEQWAYCFRLRNGLNTNMHIERMHRTIKYLYLNGKFVKRLDKAINAILKFVRDKAIERLVHKGKVCTKLSGLRQRHKSSESLDISKVVPIDMGWMVPSESSKEIYIVEEQQSECSCKLICNECNACIHRYTCSCLDCSIRWNMCKHIHLVCKFTQNSPTTSISIEAENVLSGNLVMALDDNEKEEEITSLVKSVSSTREKLQGDASLILHEEQRKLAQTLMKQIFATRSLEEVEAIKKMNAPLQRTLDAIRSKLMS